MGSGRKRSGGRQRPAFPHPAPRKSQGVPGRFPAYVELARDLAGPGGRLDPGVIGGAVERGVVPPQDLKKVWHYLARFSAGVYEPRLTPPAERGWPHRCA
ncbi:hypothetical protein [Streptomyces koyangensis]